MEDFHRATLDPELLRRALLCELVMDAGRLQAREATNLSLIREGLILPYAVKAEQGHLGFSRLDIGSDASAELNEHVS